jgi:hypothetical protein
MINQLTNPTPEQIRNAEILQQIAEDLARKSTELSELEERIFPFNFSDEDYIF